MSVFLTPELKPFVGGTYFPPEDTFGRPGFATVLQSIAEKVCIIHYSHIHGWESLLYRQCLI